MTELSKTSRCSECLQDPGACNEACNRLDKRQAGLLWDAIVLALRKENFARADQLITQYNDGTGQQFTRESFYYRS